MGNHLSSRQILEKPVRLLADLHSVTYKPPDLEGSDPLRKSKVIHCFKPQTTNGKCTFELYKRVYLHPYLCIVFFLFNPSESDFNRKILSASTQHRSVERMLYILGSCQRIETPAEPLIVGVVTEDYTQQRDTTCTSVHMVSGELVQLARWLGPGRTTAVTHNDPIHAHAHTV